MQDNTPAPTAARPSAVWRRLKWLLALLLLAAICIAAALAVREMRTSRLQARYFTSIDRKVSFHVAPGPSDSIRFPTHGGPYDLRMGYEQLPTFTQRLAERGFSITAQARQSPEMQSLADRGLFMPYDEKDQAGLELFDRTGAPLFAGRYPQRVYGSFESIPPVIVNALTFVEDRLLLDDSQPLRNPAVNWGRFTLAAGDQALRVLGGHHGEPGGSTLATQIEKFRHSPRGRTGTPSEKLHQMVSASLAAYLHGEDTLPTRRQILVHYLNTEPLAAQAGGGEIEGLGDGLAAWYGRDFDQVNRLLRGIGGPGEAVDPRPLAPQLGEQALALKETLSLLIAQRAPSYYLLQNNGALEEMTNSYLRVLAANGIVPEAVRDAAAQQKLKVRHQPSQLAHPSFAAAKAASLTRVELMGALGVEKAYELDRLDLSARSTLDSKIEQEVSDRLARVTTSAGAKEAGLYGFEMLRPGDDPSHIAYSFTLYERTPGADVLRVQTDSVNQPFDVNQGARLNLGSTAKLRTVVLYLQIISELHGRYAHLDRAALDRVQPDRLDALSAWALGYLRGASDTSLEPMLAAAVQRTYSANPGEVFETGGGEQTFTNFEPAENSMTMTVHDAFQHSVNLVFVRLMRDIVHYEMIQQAGPSAQWLSDPAIRRKYLTDFADQESIVFLDRFEKKFRGLTPDQALAKLLAGVHHSPHRVAAALRSVAPDAPLSWFETQLRATLKGTPAAKMPSEDVAKLYEKYGPDRFNLTDRAYLAGMHPVELWLVGYLRAHPNAGETELRQASHDARIASYAWLFNQRVHGTQDRRIRQTIEREAYEPILASWRALGYPFHSITPSYGAAVGAAGDRPSALAHLMGIIADQGKQLDTEDLTALTFAAGTPFETHFDHLPSAGRLVLSPAIVEQVRTLLRDVVTGGTAKRLADGLPLGHGDTLDVYGKTGTGDQRFNVYARGGGLVESRKVNRTATFVYMIGDRFYGSLTAYAHEPYAARYAYTSAMAVQLLKSLGPVLGPMLRSPQS